MLTVVPPRSWSRVMSKLTTRPLTGHVRMPIGAQIVSLFLSARREVGKEFEGVFDVMERDDDTSQLSVRARRGLQWF